MRWSKAKEYCASIQGHLVTIGSKAEDDFVYQLYPNTWLGLTDGDQEGNWQWVTGEPLIYTHWADTEPDNCAHGCRGLPPNSEEEDYAHYEVDSPLWGDWGDVESPFICEWEPSE